MPATRHATRWVPSPHAFTSCCCISESRLLRFLAASAQAGADRDHGARCGAPGLTALLRGLISGAGADEDARAGADHGARGRPHAHELLRRRRVDARRAVKLLLRRARLECDRNALHRECAVRLSACVSEWVLRECWGPTVTCLRSNPFVVSGY